jgi:hypothetical protein
MHGRRSVVLLVLVALFTAIALPAAHASSGRLKDTVVIAQEDTGAGQDDEGAGQESGGEGEGQDDPEAETGAGAGESEDVAEETGPVWTYQMARIVVVLLVLLIAAITLLYWRLVGRRRRSGIV